MFGCSIWLAYSSYYKCNITIKVISKVEAQSEYLLKCVPREVAILKTIRHQNLIYIYQTCETTDRVFIVMEYAENSNLLEMIKTEKFIVEPVAGRWFHQLIDGVEYCHSRGIAHRNLNCENVLLDRRYNIKITNFSFAKYCLKDVTYRRPQIRGVYCGNFAYASPEIVSDVQYNPMLADIWSCGVILTVMVFGRLPFDDTNIKRLSIQMQNLPPAIPIPLAPIVSQDCCHLIKKVLVVAKRRLRISDIRIDPWFRRIYPFIGPRLQLVKQQGYQVCFPFNVL